MQQNTEGLEQEVVSRQNKVLSRSLASRVGLLAGLLLVGCAVLAVHWPALSAQALSFDDNQYLTKNLLVQNPGWASARRFLTEVLEPSTVGGYYQPLAMLSLMTDYALGGREDNLRPFHRTSLALHVANTMLVTVLLYLLFGRVWIAAAVGLLFGLHPMTVEPIPWVGERKTLLAAFFAFWSLVLYVCYARKSSWKLYLSCIVMYVLALMSKPTSLPLPLLMLLLDYWPLGRLSKKTILEKLPFFVVAGISAVITYISQSRTAAVMMPGEYGPERIPLILCHNIIFYIYKIIWPANLSSHYAYPQPLALSDPMVLAGVIGTFILIALLVISLRWTRAPLTGWLIFFAAILPTMQIMGFSNVIASDKFAYLPSVGLLVVLVPLLAWLWGVGRSVMRRVAVIIIVLILAGAEAVATRRYLMHWRDTVSLFEHMLTITPNAAPVYNNLGFAFYSQGKLDVAIGHYRKALQIKPDYAGVHNNLGFALYSQDKLDEAISCYRQALWFKPDYAEAFNNLGLALQSQDKLDEAISCYRQALKFKPSLIEAHSNLGKVLQSQDRLDEAASHYRQALRFKPNYADVHNNLGIVLKLQGRLGEAISHYRRALQARPDYANAHYNLGLALRLEGKLDEAISHFRDAIRIAPDYAPAHYNLALALRMTGRLDAALEHFREVVRLKSDYPAALNGMAQILTAHPDPKLRNVAQAIELAERAAELTGYRSAAVLNTLAAAYAAAGRFDQAVTTAQKALTLASAIHADQLANRIRKRLELYRQAKPYRDSMPEQDAVHP